MNRYIGLSLLACEQDPVGRAERELASSEVARGSGGACGQRLYAAVLCTRFWCNLQLVRSLIVDRDWRSNLPTRFDQNLHIISDMIEVKTWPFFWRWAAHRRSVWKSTERFAQGFRPYDTAERRTKTLLAISGRKKGCFRNPSHSIPIQSRLIAATSKGVENECKRWTARRAHEIQLRLTLEDLLLARLEDPTFSKAWAKITLSILSGVYK